MTVTKVIGHGPPAGPAPQTHARMATNFCVPDALAVFKSQRGGCSQVDWEERVAAALPRQSPVTYVNVGANKGYKVPAFLALWSQQHVPGYVGGWQHHLIKYATEHKSGFLKRFSCGNCNDCKAKPPAAHNRDGGRMHLFELASANRELLRYVIEAERLGDRVQLHNLAASNTTHQLSVFKDLMAGDERGQALTGAKAARFKKADASTMVPAVALDDFFRAQRLSHIYHVAVDTEGWDALVVEGMRGALSRREISLLEFEVNNRGMWNRYTAGREVRTVEGTLSMLHAAGYRCFWVLTKSLLPASGQCWLDAYAGRPEWSNMLCAHEPPVLEVLDGIAREGYAARQNGARGR